MKKLTRLVANELASDIEKTKTHLKELETRRGHRSTIIRLYDGNNSTALAAEWLPIKPNVMLDIYVQTAQKSITDMESDISRLSDDNAAEISRKWELDAGVGA